MPAEGLDWLPTEETAHRRRGRPAGPDRRRAARHREVRFTGGEPLLRRGLPDIVAPSEALAPRPRGLAHDQRHRPGPDWPTALAAAGLDRVNVCLDTVRPRRCSPRSPGATGCTTCWPGSRRPHARRARPGQGQRGAAARGQRREAPSCCATASTTATSCGSSSRCRWTPSTTGARRRWSPPTEILASLRAEFTSRPTRSTAAARRPRLFLVDGGPAKVGVIASVTRPFCGDCDRVRLTADGQVRNCLFAREESDLRGRAARRRRRRRDRRPVAHGDVDQAPRPRHRRPGVPAAGPADVRHRRLSERRRRKSAEVAAAFSRTRRSRGRIDASRNPRGSEAAHLQPGVR